MSFAEGKGEYREPGLQENSVRNFTGRRIPPLPFALKHALFFLQNGHFLDTLKPPFY